MERGRGVWRVRLWTLLSMVVIVPVGLATKRYHVSGAEWIHSSSGGALYVLFFALAALLVLPRARPWIIAAAVTAATCGVELSQRWHPPWLEAVRATRVGGLLLGSTFMWGDLPWYFIGGGIAWLWLALLGRPLRERG